MATRKTEHTKKNWQTIFENLLIGVGSVVGDTSFQLSSKRCCKINVVPKCYLPIVRKQKKIKKKHTINPSTKSLLGDSLWSSQYFIFQLNFSYFMFVSFCRSDYKYNNNHLREKNFVFPFWTFGCLLLTTLLLLHFDYIIWSKSNSFQEFSVNWTNEREKNK